jgi:hypothetical protein
MSTLISSIVTESHTESEALGGKKRSIMIPKQPLDVRDGYITFAWVG